MPISPSSEIIALFTLCMSNVTQGNYTWDFDTQIYKEWLMPTFDTLSQITQINYMHNVII